MRAFMPLRYWFYSGCSRARCGYRSGGRSGIRSCLPLRAFSWRCSPVQALPLFIRARTSRSAPSPARGTVRDRRVRIPVCALGASQTRQSAGFCAVSIRNRSRRRTFRLPGLFLPVLRRPRASGLSTSGSMKASSAVPRACSTKPVRSAISAPFSLIMMLVAWNRPRADRPCLRKTALAAGAIVSLCLNPFLFASFDRERDDWLPRTHVPSESEDGQNAVCGLPGGDQLQES